MGMEDIARIVTTTAEILGTRNTTMNDDEILQNLQEKRTRCIVYTRVMGYHRPVESFNLGKKGEHAERVKFEEKKNKRIANGKI